MCLVWCRIVHTFDADLKFLSALMTQSSFLEVMPGSVGQQDFYLLTIQFYICIKSTFPLPLNT